MNARFDIVRWRRFVAAVMRTAGAVALERATPVFAGLGIVAAVLFGGNGIDAATVTSAAAKQPLVHTALTAAWLVVAAPIVRASLRARTAMFLRTMPVPAAWGAGAFAAIALALQMPWIVLFARGAGAIAATSHALTAAGITAMGSARPWHRAEKALVAATAIAAIVAPAIVAIALGAALLAHASRSAWLRAYDEARRGRSRVGGPPAVALALAFALAPLRVERATFARGIAFAGCAGALSALGVRNNAIGSASAAREALLTFAALALTAAAAAILGPVLRASNGLARVVRASARDTSRVVGEALAVAAFGASFGAVFAAAALATGPSFGAAHGARAMLGAISLGAALASSALAAVRRVEARGNGAARASSGASVATLVALGLASLAAISAFGERALVALAAIALLISFVARRAAAVRSRRMDATGSARDTAAAIEVRALRKWYGGRAVLDGIDFTWRGPGVLALRGENGSGKSTLLGVLAGVVAPDEGAVSICGERLDRRRVEALARVGWVPDSIDLPEHLTVAELADLVASLKRAKIAGPDVAERVGVTALLGERLRALSLGQRRRAGIYVALAGDPELLIFDEPTNGLDGEGLTMLRELLEDRSARGRAAIVATHDAGFAAAVASAMLTLRSGRAALAAA